MIPPLVLGRTRPPTGHRTLLDRVFPPSQCDDTIGDLWAAGRSVLAYGAWSTAAHDRAAS